MGLGIPQWQGDDAKYSTFSLIRAGESADDVKWVPPWSTAASTDERYFLKLSNLASHTDDLPKEFRVARKVVVDKMTDEIKKGNNNSSQAAYRYATEVKNPCLKETEQSLKCMGDSGYDRDQCTLYFRNYRNCMDFWGMVQRDRRRKGIKPYLPLPEDRNEIRTLYWPKFTGTG